MVRVPAETDLALYAPLGCGMQTGAGAVLNSLNVKEGSTVAVFGVGSVGMAAVMAAAKIRKARIVIAVDLQQSRLDLAKELGATHGVLGNAKDVVQQIRDICQSNGCDYAVDATGVPFVIKTMIDSLGTLGRASTVGAPGPGNNVAVDIMEHLTYGKEYVGCCEGDSLPKEVSSPFFPLLWALTDMTLPSLCPISSSSIKRATSRSTGSSSTTTSRTTRRPLRTARRVAPSRLFSSGEGRRKKGE